MKRNIDIFALHFFLFSLFKASDAKKLKKIMSTTEYEEPLYGQSSSNYTPKPIRERKRSQISGAGEFIHNFHII